MSQAAALGARGRPGLELGLRPNLGQFSLLLVINAFVGAMVGMERSVLPVLAEREFGIASRAAILSFVVAFGLVKALTNVVAGSVADRWGRRRVLLTGWLAALPVPFMIMFAPDWGWVVAANVLLGINQGLCWSTAVVMKMDLAGPRQRGLAIGLNESSGYLAVSLAALASGYLAARYGLRPQPFWIGVVATLGGLACSAFVRETRRQSVSEPANPSAPPPRLGAIVRRVSWSDGSLRAVSQAGLVNNLNDGASWGLFPLFFISNGASLVQTAALVALYPAVWGLAQLGTGLLSDRLGRRWLMAGGMGLQGLALVALARTHVLAAWVCCLVAYGLGTALVYPTFLAAVADHSESPWRATAIGIYRGWRDLGYAVGACLAGAAADRLGVPPSIALVGALTILSGVAVATTYEDHRVSRP